MIASINIILECGAGVSVRKLCALALIVYLAPAVSAQLDVQVEPVSCPSGMNPLVTIDEPNSTTGNPGGLQGREPSLFRHKVCVGGVEAPTIQDSCPGTPSFYLYSRGTDAHFSNTSIYPTEVCTGRLQINLRSLDPDGDGAVEQRNPCETGEQPLFSVSNFTNAHIGSPYNDFYRFKACGLLKDFAPESVQIRLELSSSNPVSSDGESLAPGEKLTSLDYPYIASSGGSAVAGLAARSANTTLRLVEDGDNTLVLTRASSEGVLGPGFSASVFVPFTRGGFDSIRQRKEIVTNGNLLGTWNPTFGFPNPDTGSRQSKLRVYLDSDLDLKNNMSLEPGSYQLELEKTGENEVSVRTR